MFFHHVDAFELCFDQYSSTCFLWGGSFFNKLGGVYTDRSIDNGRHGCSLKDHERHSLKDHQGAAGHNCSVLLCEHLHVKGGSMQSATQHTYLDKVYHGDPDQDIALFALQFIQGHASFGHLFSDGITIVTDASASSTNAEQLRTLTHSRTP
jgi:hypothetical protein